MVLMGVGVVVDRDDQRTLLHAGDVLYLTGDTASDVELGTRDTCLPDLSFMSGITGINGGTGRPHLGTQHVGELIEQVKVLFEPTP